jgi:hypothetical protein
VKVYFGSYAYFVIFLGAFGVITWLLGLPWYAVALLAAGMIGLRAWAALAIKRYDRHQENL